MADTAAFPYETRLNILQGPLEVVDAKALADACEFKWFNQTLCRVNASVVRLGIFEGEYHWHKHDDEDEFFLVLDGQLLLDVEGKSTITLDAHLGYRVPTGVFRGTRSPKKTVVLMVEAATVTRTGD